MKKLLLFACFSLLCFCCNDIDNEQELNIPDIISEKNVIEEAKKDFCKALVRVMSESEDARKLIKNEALRKINFDMMCFMN